jgi:hypothetical protein
MHGALPEHARTFPFRPNPSNQQSLQLHSLAEAFQHMQLLAETQKGQWCTLLLALEETLEVFEHVTDRRERGLPLPNMGN